MFIIDFFTFRKLKEKTWKKLSYKKRVDFFQKLENKTAKKVGRKTYTILPKSLDDSTNGLCDYSSFVIYLNSKIFALDNLQFYGLATLFHEQRHAEQHFVVKTKKKIFKFSKAYKWQKNMNSYISYDGNEKYSYYSMQEIERDANKNALERLRKLYRVFKREDLYKKTLYLKEKEFEYVKQKAKSELGFFYKLKLFLRQKKEEKKNAKK